MHRWSGIRVVFALCLLVLGASDSFAQQPKAKVAALPAGTRIERNLEYGPHGERNKLDLYRPAESRTPLPLVIWIHGGAWQSGSKEGGNPALRLLDKGYAVAAINYRLSQQAKWPAQIEDCKAAVRYLRANAKKYDLDPDHFGVWGSSAGGHLVAMLGTSGDVKSLEGNGEHPNVSSRVQAVCDFFGPTDFTKMNEQAGQDSRIDHDSAEAPEAKLIGGAVPANKEKAQAANPITYVTKDDAPILILHGTADPLVPVGQSELLDKALKAAGVESTLIVIEGAGHGPGIGTPENMVKVTQFFDKHLKLDSSKPES